MRRIVLSLLLLAAVSGHWELQQSGVKANFRGVSAVSDRVAWVSGTNGTFGRTADGGKTWEMQTVKGAEKLDFRDIEAFDAETAYLLSIGNGDSSRIYKTTDGGRNWTAQYSNSLKDAFFDAFAFRDRNHGLTVSDPVEGKFLVLRTTDGGANWTQTPRAGIPDALPGEGAFAASGTCIAVAGKQAAWFVTGGAVETRVFRSTDDGTTWSVASTPIPAAIPSRGIFSVAFRDDRTGIIVGGDYQKPDQAENNIAMTTDAGKTWTLVKDGRLGGFRSAVAYLPGTRGRQILAVGPSGTDWSGDGGLHWQPFDTTGFHAISFAPGIPTAWAAGADGRIGNCRF